jgi:hypothetical protein
LDSDTSTASDAPFTLKVRKNIGPDIARTLDTFALPLIVIYSFVNISAHIMADNATFQTLKQDDLRKLLDASLGLTRDVRGLRKLLGEGSDIERLPADTATPLDTIEDSLASIQETRALIQELTSRLKKASASIDEATSSHDKSPVKAIAGVYGSATSSNAEDSNTIHPASVPSNGFSAATDTTSAAIEARPAAIDAPLAATGPNATATSATLSADIDNSPANISDLPPNIDTSPAVIGPTLPAIDLNRPGIFVHIETYNGKMYDVASLPMESEEDIAFAKAVHAADLDIKPNLDGSTNLAHPSIRLGYTIVGKTLERKRGRGYQPYDGDWYCEACGFWNPELHRTCRRDACAKPKPDDARVHEGERKKRAAEEHLLVVGPVRPLKLRYNKNAADNRRGWALHRNGGSGLWE